MSVIRVELQPAGKGRTAVVAPDGATLACGRGAVICAAARRLILEGHSLDCRLEAWRAGTLCLTGSLAAFAKLTVTDAPSGNGPAFVEYRPGPNDRGNGD